MSGQVYKWGMGRNVTEDAADTQCDVRAMHEAINVRLQRQVLRMVEALEAIEPPSDHLGIERMAKAVMAVRKANEMINAVPQEDADDEQRELDAMHDDDLPPTTGPDALDAWAELLERKIARYRDAGKGDGLVPAAHAGGTEGDQRGLGLLGQSGASRT